MQIIQSTTNHKSSSPEIYQNKNDPVGFTPFSNTIENTDDSQGYDKNNGSVNDQIEQYDATSNGPLVKSNYVGSILNTHGN
jgi:hypothetical protein